MKKLISYSILLSVLFTSGCSLFTKEVIVYKNHYLRQEIPSDLTTAPPPIQYLDTNDINLSQRDVSAWITKHINRELTLEDKLNKIHELELKRNKEIEELNKNDSVNK